MLLRERAGRENAVGLVQELQRVVERIVASVVAAHRRLAKHVDAEDHDALLTRNSCACAGLDDRHDAVDACDLLHGLERLLGKARLSAGHAQRGAPRERADALGEVLDRRSVDDRDRDVERGPARDAQDGEGGSERVRQERDHDEVPGEVTPLHGSPPTL